MNARRLIWTFCAIAAFFVAAILTGIVVTNWFARLDVEAAGSRYAVDAKTPAGNFSVENFPGSVTTLMDVFYPRSMMIGREDKDFYRGDSGDEKKFAQLIVLRFSTPADQHVVTEWYRAKLGSTLKECPAWPCGNMFSEENWAELVSDPAISPSSTFQEESENWVRGVRLAFDKAESVTTISFYDFKFGGYRNDSSSK